MKSPSEKKLARIERELSKICFADVRELAAIVPDFTFEDGAIKTESVKSLANLPKSLAAAASSIKIKVTATAAEVEVKLCDKFKALDMYRSMLSGSGIGGGQAFSVAYDYRKPDTAVSIEEEKTET